MRSKSINLVMALLLLPVGCGGGGPSIAAPSELAVDAFSPTQVGLSWKDNANNEDAFRIYRSEDGTNFTLVGTNTFELYPDDTVSQGTLYYYRVTAYNTTDESNPSNTVSVTPDNYYVDILTPNDGPTLTIGSTYNVTWDTNMPGFDAVIKFSTDGGSSWEDIEWGWGPDTSPYPWEVGYGWVNIGPPLDPVYEWQQIVSSSETDCLIYIEDYNDPSVNDTSDVVFTITP